MNKKRTWWELESANGASGSASGSEGVVSGRVDFGVAQFGDVEVGHVFCVGGVAIVTRRNDRVENLLEELEALLVAGDQPTRLDHRVP